MPVMATSRGLRVFSVWVLLIAAEVVHGVARTVWPAPAVGDFRARQLAVVTGSLLVLAIVTMTIQWINVAGTRTLVSVGLVWVVLTITFEVSLGRALLGYSWARLASDYNLLEGGFLPVGLTVMAMSPSIATRLRRWWQPPHHGVV